MRLVLKCQTTEFLLGRTMAQCSSRLLLRCRARIGNDLRMSDEEVGMSDKEVGCRLKWEDLEMEEARFLGILLYVRRTIKKVMRVVA